jgi:Bacterial Ig-like domain
MKQKSLLTMLLVAMLGQFTAGVIRAQTVDSIAPVVVKTVPEAGSKDVAPGEMEIKVKFSKEMTDQSWSWSTAWQDSTPESIGKPHYEADHRTCVLKVKLQPNKTYGYWINSQRFHGFRDTEGHPAVPYLLVFQTKGN